MELPTRISWQTLVQIQMEQMPDNDDVLNNADIWRSEYARRCFETLKSVEFLTALISVPSNLMYVEAC